VITKLDGILLEDEHKVVGFRRFLPAEGKRKRDLIQFWAEQGGQRTVAVADVVDVS
jgi:low affinity Fe/Cu permease